MTFLTSPLSVDDLQAMKVKILNIKAHEGEHGEQVPEMRANAPVATEIMIRARHALCQTESHLLIQIMLVILTVKLMVGCFRCCAVPIDIINILINNFGGVLIKFISAM